MATQPWKLLSALTLLLAFGCDSSGTSAPAPSGSDGVDRPAGLAVSMYALTDGSYTCDSGVSNPDPAAEIDRITVTVTGVDPTKDDGQAVQLARRNINLSNVDSVTVDDIPEGDGHTIEVFGRRAGEDAVSWYARNPNLKIVRNQTNDVELLLTQFGGVLCTQSADAAFTNVVFPGTVTLGDGRIMSMGGFTQLVNDAGEVYLGQPSSQMIVFNPSTGALEGPINLGVETRRAAHEMVFIPPASDDEEGQGKVLIVGGTTRLTYDDQRPFPLRADPNHQYSLKDALLIDVATLSLEATYSMATKRVFPRAGLMSDGTVVVTGGGKWPNEESALYQEVEVFDVFRAEEDGGPGFLDTNSFESYVPRSGHSLTFIKRDAQGQSQYLLFGGTHKLKPQGGNMAEVMRQSSQQRFGVDGSFDEVAVIPVAGFNASFSLYFHHMTPLGERSPNQWYFLATGGQRLNEGADTSRLPVSGEGESWLLRYSEGDNSVPEPTLEVKRIEGFGAGRVFHAAFSPADGRVAVLGGLTARASTSQSGRYEIPALTTGTSIFFEHEGALNGSWQMGSDDQGFIPRGAFGALGAGTGSAVLIGGEDNMPTSFTFAAGTAPQQRALIEVYTPSNIPTP